MPASRGRVAPSGAGITPVGFFTPSFSPTVDLGIGRVPRWASQSPINFERGWLSILAQYSGLARPEPDVDLFKARV
ncbi:hypothetical protein AXF42_Ash003011 [Apostasia shenzhenica]|uniref:Uncharacterized protein n=1 Tax=Apostasia shenzhenica TaxID=1088818 RepID=A0A2I0A7Z2_9ASPA|nr:hypothetical protein AXF42_Ash003011 [Apostasia shenzhenica]